MSLEDGIGLNGRTGVLGLEVGVLGAEICVCVCVCVCVKGKVRGAREIEVSVRGMNVTVATCNH